MVYLQKVPRIVRKKGLFGFFSPQHVVAHMMRMKETIITMG